MSKQIEIFSPDDPVIKDIIETSKINTYPCCYDNETGELTAIYFTKQRNVNHD